MRQCCFLFTDQHQHYPARLVGLFGRAQLGQARCGAQTAHARLALAGAFGAGLRRLVHRSKRAFVHHCGGIVAALV